jgi:hypothetical protein
MTSLSRGCRWMYWLVLFNLCLPLFSGHELAALSDRDVVLQWNTIAEKTITPRVFQNEGLIYMAYVSAAMYDAVVLIKGGFEPYGLDRDACLPAEESPSGRKSGFRTEVKPGASVQAAVATAAYQTLLRYFPGDAATLNARYAESLASLSDGASRQDGVAVGQAVASQLICLRAGDKLPPYKTTSAVDAREPGPGVWRLTPPYAAAQTPWVGDVQPFVLNNINQFRPAPPPALSSPGWVAQFNEVKQDGSVANTGTARGATATFWTANVISQYNGMARDQAVRHDLDVSQSARLLAMINIVGADAQIAVMHWKYHFLFWRPVTAIDPCSVTADGFGPATCDPGNLDTDSNPNTVEEVGWRPFVTPTPNHPEYPGAHGSITGAVAQVLEEFFGTNRLDLTIHGVVAINGVPADTVRQFTTTDQIVAEVVDARTWGGLHYRGSTEAGVKLGQKVARFDLNHAFGPAR